MDIDELAAPRGESEYTLRRVSHIGWLDGVRACAALYVVLHHIYLGVFPGFPLNDGPWYLAWLMYGHLAVVVFIVVSGFSLGLAPARNQGDLKGGAWGFFARRAWRILPPYWSALLFSMAVSHFLFVEQPGHEVNLRTLVVHAFLAHDILPSNSPNSAFWSIAVEAQIYLVFPLMLVASRLRSPVFAAVSVLAIACMLHAAAQNFSVLSRLDHLNLQLYVGFAFGLWAVNAALSPAGRARNWPLFWVAAAVFAAVIAADFLAGFPKVVKNFFWIDIAVAFAAALCFVRLVDRSSSPSRVLSSRPLEFVGTFSYSLYLVHVPIVGFLMFSPPIENPLLKYVVVASVILPVTVAFAYLFFLMFERPFLTIRSWPAFRAWFVGYAPALNSND